MATLDMHGMEDLSTMFQDLSPIPDDVMTDAINAMAAVAEKAVRQEGERMGVRDPESSVHVLDKITHTKIKMIDDGAVTYVTFKGSRRRGKTTTREAEIAFINEYGKRGQAPRPFIRVTAEAEGDAIAAAGEKAIGDWWEKASGGTSS